MAITLEVYLCDHVIRGELRSEGERRAVDILNESALGILTLSDAWIGNSHVHAAPIKVEQIRIQRPSILFVVPHDTAPRGPRQLRSAFVEKRPLRTVLGLGPFTVAGTIHVGQYETVADNLAQAGIGRAFIPITRATVSSQYDASVSLEAGIVLVHRPALTYTATPAPLPAP